MFPALRCMESVTRVIRKARSGHLERHNIASLSPDINAVAVLKYTIIREFDSAQVLHSLNPDCIFKGPPVKMDDPVQLMAEVHHENVQRYNMPVSYINPARSTPLLASRQTRGFHTSSCVTYDSTSYGMTDVPDFLVKYKQRRATFLTDSEAEGHEHEELGLMPPLTHSILSGDVVASTRRLEAKIPVEHQVAEGHVVHPSGFVIPGPGHTSSSGVARAKEGERNESVDRALQKAAVAHRVLESDFEHVAATTFPSSHKVPFEVCETDGTVKHPSGFEPPTLAREFRYPANMIRDRKVSSARSKVRVRHIGTSKGS